MSIEGLEELDELEEQNKRINDQSDCVRLVDVSKEGFFKFVLWEDLDTRISKDCKPEGLIKTNESGQYFLCPRYMYENYIKLQNESSKADVNLDQSIILKTQLRHLIDDIYKFEAYYREYMFVLYSRIDLDIEHIYDLTVEKDLYEFQNDHYKKLQDLEDVHLGKKVDIEVILSNKTAERS